MSGDFELLESSDNHQQVKIRFSGQHQNQPVEWTARLMTLSHYRQENPEQETVRRFIQMEPVCGNQGKLNIGLNVPVIDDPTIFKTIIMVRNWKNLGPGFHAYGELIS